MAGVKCAASTPPLDDGEAIALKVRVAARHPVAGIEDDRVGGELTVGVQETLGAMKVVQDRLHPCTAPPPIEPPQLRNEAVREPGAGQDRRIPLTIQRRMNPDDLHIGRYPGAGQVIESYADRNAEGLQCAVHALEPQQSAGEYVHFRNHEDRPPGWGGRCLRHGPLLAEKRDLFHAFQRLEPRRLQLRDQTGRAKPGGIAIVYRDDSAIQNMRQPPQEIVANHGIAMVSVDEQHANRRLPGQCRVPCRQVDQRGMFESASLHHVHIKVAAINRAELSTQHAGEWYMGIDAV